MSANVPFFDQLMLGFLMYSPNLLMLCSAIYNLQKKNCLINFFTAMISEAPSKDPIYKRILRFNILSAPSVMNWYKLRRTLLQAGGKFTNRLDIYSSIFSLVYLIFFAIIALKELNIMKFTLSPKFTRVSLSEKNSISFLSRIIIIMILRNHYTIL